MSIRLRRIFNQLLRHGFRKDELSFLIFFVTSRCNAPCKTCFYWESLNKNEDLSLEEIGKVSQTLGTFSTLLYSGGEPTLRKDLVEVTGVFVGQNKVRLVAVPTNGLNTEHILEVVERLLRAYPGTQFSINPSVDGFAQTSDDIRAVPEGTKRAFETIRRLTALKTRFSNLQVVMNTVICKRNAEELPAFMKFVREEFDLDYHHFELLRGNPKDPTFELPSAEQIQSLHRLDAENRERYLGRKPRSSFLERLITVGFLRKVQKAKEMVLESGRLPHPCLGGSTIGVLDANGDVRPCELLPPMGNVRKVGYDFRKIWKAPQADRVREDIQHGCKCTHVCFISATQAAQASSLASIPMEYARFRLSKTDSA